VSFRTAAASILLLGTTPAWAALGGSAATVATDRQQLRGELRSVAAEGFSVQEISAADGSVVREYVSPSGRVFAVSWRGPVRPDLALVLGDYFREFQQASRSRLHRRGPLVVRTDRLVVEMGGHMRAFHGRAYVPDLLPVTLSLEVVR
jgi:hypothetical protein